jgi:hypothetical protein
MLKVILAALAILASSVDTYAQQCAKVSPTPHRSGTFTAGALQGRLLGDLYAGYTGVKGSVPEKITVDPARQLDSLWRVKLKCNRSNVVAQKLHTSLMLDYRANRTHITVDEFVAIAEKEVAIVNRHMDWQKLAMSYRLNEAQIQTVRLLSGKISGIDLIAYGLTEIMPSADGTLNVRVLEFLVRNYGPEFVYAIPARHDRYASFGFYQFTSLAVFDIGTTMEGASKASRSLREERLPGSTVLIRGDLQHLAAYLFAIHNIAVLVKGLNTIQRSRINALPVSKHDDLIQFIAAAHNGPVHARSAAKRWLDNRMQLEYSVSVSVSAVRRYAEKTRANLNALLSRPSLAGILYEVKP